MLGKRHANLQSKRKIPSVHSRTKGIAFRGTTSVRRIIPRRTHHPDQHQGLAITGSPCRSNLQTENPGFLRQASGRLSTPGNCGGSQPMTTPSLSVPGQPTPPRESKEICEDNFWDYTELFSGRQRGNPEVILCQIHLTSPSHLCYSSSIKKIHSHQLVGYLGIAPGRERVG